MTDVRKDSFIGRLVMVTPAWNETDRRIAKVVTKGKKGADYRVQYLDDDSVREVNMFRLKPVSPLQALAWAAE